MGIKIESGRVAGAIGAVSLLCAAMWTAPPVHAGSEQVVFYGAGPVKQRDEQSYAWVKDHGTSMVISGNGENVPVDELKRKLNGDFIWFRDGERTFVIVDPALLARVASFWAQYEATSDTEATAHKELRKQEKTLDQMRSAAKQGESAPQGVPARGQGSDGESAWQVQKALVARLRAAHAALVASRTTAFKQCQASARALFDQAIRDGKASPWPLA